MKKACFCSAGAGQTGSRRSTGREMDIFCYTSVCQMDGFQWPRSEAELRLIDHPSFRWLMEGLEIEQRTAIRKGKPKDLF